jgi:hypothetical protein
MTIVLQIKDGYRYTLWNVVHFVVHVDHAVVVHADRPDTIVQGRMHTIKRIDTD